MNILLTYVGIYFPFLESKLQVMHKLFLCDLVEKDEIRLPVLRRAKCSHVAPLHAGPGPLL